ncbi:MAG: IS110 family transposase [Planctomycetia bacterium]|nr:IS110 family transposase [Planctomycetia bacterium]
METQTILALDLGRFNSVLCWYDPVTRVAEYRTIRSTPDDISRELTREPVGTIVFEACSQAGWVNDLCESLGLPALVASTTGSAWQWKRIKRKTDRDDAFKLARMAAVGEIDPVAFPDRATRQWKSLIGLRKRLVSERIRSQNRIRGLLVSQGLSSPRGASAWTSSGLNGLMTLCLALHDCPPDQLWRGELLVLLDRYRSLEQEIRVTETALDALAKKDHRCLLLQSIPGIGLRTAEVIAVHFPDARRFRSADEVSAYAGLVPRQYQSGETDRRGHITRRGPKLLRAAMVECAWCSLRYNAWARDTWLRLQANGLSKKKAIVALARKLLVRAWAILRTGRPWHAPTVSTA